MGEPIVKLRGTVEGEGDAAVLVRAVVRAPGIQDAPFSRGDAIAIVTDEGERVTVRVASDATVLPERSESGAWHELTQHATRPRGDFHPDGHVTVKGAWITPGQTVWVAGHATQHAFVADTGGHRAAPEQRVSELAAIAITASERTLVEAVKAWDVAPRSDQPKRPLDKQRVFAWIAGSFAAIALAMFAVAFAGVYGAWGTGISAAFLAFMFLWPSLPLRPFPGGAADRESTDRDAWAYAVTMAMLVAPLPPIFWFIGKPHFRDAACCSAVLLIGPLPLYAMWQAVLAKPRAVPGKQTHLPRDKRWRWFVLLGATATLLAAAIVAVPFVLNEPSA